MRAIICNKCGKRILNKIDQNLIHDFTVRFGYGSKHDSEIINFDVCEGCLLKWLKDFRLNPLEEDNSIFIDELVELELNNSGVDEFLTLCTKEATNKTENYAKVYYKDNIPKRYREAIIDNGIILNFVNWVVTGKDAIKLVEDLSLNYESIGVATKESIIVCY